jgi:hypothetical protein
LDVTTLEQHQRVFPGNSNVCIEHRQRSNATVERTKNDVVSNMHRTSSYLIMPPPPPKLPSNVSNSTNSSDGVCKDKIAVL